MVSDVVSKCALIEQEQCLKLFLKTSFRKLRQNLGWKAKKDFTMCLQNVYSKKKEEIVFLFLKFTDL